MSEKPERRIADEIVALRIGLHRELDRLFVVLQDPGFQGNVTIEINAKDGRPAKPRVTVSRLGFSE